MELILPLISVLGWLGVGLLTDRSNEVLRQILDGRLQKIEHDFRRVDEIFHRELQELEKTLREYQVYTQKSFLSRDDWIRFSTVLEAKIDRLNDKLESVKLEVRHGKLSELEERNHGL